MKIKHNFILMFLVLSLLILILFLNNFNLLTIDESYYNNFEVIVTSNAGDNKNIKFIVQTENSNYIVSEIEKLLTDVFNLTTDGFDLILLKANKNIPISNEKELIEILNNSDYLIEENLDLMTAKNNIKNIVNKGKIIIITDGIILDKKLSFSDFNRLKQAGIKVNIIQLKKPNEIEQIRLKSLAKLGGGEYLEQPSANEVYKLLKKED